jgi:hypothetical protein
MEDKPMKIRFSHPTEVFPFFHNVRVQTAKGWEKVVSYNDRIGGKDSAIFASREEMIRKVAGLVRGA